MWRLIFTVAMVVETVTPAHAAVLFSDEFAGPTLDPGWIIVNPNPDSTITLAGGGFLNISASPKNGGSDLFVGSNWNAPRLLQPVDPNLDWTVETRILFNPTNDFQDVGILLATTTLVSTNPFDFWRVSQRAFQMAGGDVIRSVGGLFPFSSDETYFRVTKQGQIYSGWFSSDGVNWTWGGSEFNATPWSYIGLNTVRQAWDGNFNVASDADFDYFRVSTVPEPLSIIWLMLIGMPAAAWERRRSKQMK